MPARLEILGPYINDRPEPHRIYMRNTAMLSADESFRLSRNMTKWAFEADAGLTDPASFAPELWQSGNAEELPSPGAVLSDTGKALAIALTVSVVLCAMLHAMGGAG